MDPTIGTMKIGDKTFQVSESKLEVVTRPERSGEWRYLFLFAGSSEEEGCYFNLDCYGLRTGTSLTNFAGGRIHVEEEDGKQADDTLSMGDDDSMIEACVWMLKDESSGEEAMWFFRRLDVRFMSLGGDRFHVLLSATLADMDENRLEASADFTVTGTSSREKER